MEKQDKNSMYAQSFTALTITTLLTTLITLPLIYGSRLAIALYGKSENLSKAYYINIFSLVILILAHVFAIINYRYLVKNNLMKETKATKLYTWISSILFILVAIGIELFVRA